MITSLLVAAGTLLAATSLPLVAQEPTAQTWAPIEDHMEWFVDGRYGMFIHWGPVALTGQEIGWSRGTKTPADKYDALHKKWNPVHFDAEEWAQLAEDAGMKYLVLTAKHHDGFCLWDSKLTEYDLASSPFQREIIGPLAAACEKRNIRFCVYYSILDWWHPHYTPQNMRFGGPGAKLSGVKPSMDVYVSYLKAQLKELIHDYDPGMIWFDGEWEKPWSKERGEDLAAFLLNLHPDLIVNNRIGKGRTAYQDGSNPGDFDTPEQKIGHFQVERPWETCMTIATQWAWKPNDPAKSLRQCVQSLVRCAAGDGNFLLNVGPLADGNIDPFHAHRLGEVGDWLRENGDTIYETRGGPWQSARWGGATTRDNKIWLHVLEWDGESLNLPAFGQKIKSVHLRRAGGPGWALTQNNLVEWEQLDGGALMIKLDQRYHDDINTIIELTVAENVNQLADPGGAMPRFLASAGGGSWISRNASFRASSTSQWDRKQDHKLLLNPGPANPEYAFHTELESNPWIEIDLGEVHRITGLEIGNRPGFESRSNGLTLSLSSDGQNWKQVWQAEEQRDHWQIAVPASSSARYLKLQTRNSDDDKQPMHLSAVKVYGRSAE